MGRVRAVMFNSSGYPLADSRAVETPIEQNTTYERDPATNALKSVTDELGRKTACGQCQPSLCNPHRTRSTSPTPFGPPSEAVSSAASGPIAPRRARSAVASPSRQSSINYAPPGKRSRSIPRSSGALPERGRFAELREPEGNGIQLCSRWWHREPHIPAAAELLQFGPVTGSCSFSGWEDVTAPNQSAAPP